MGVLTGVLGLGLSIAGTQATAQETAPAAAGTRSPAAGGPEAAFQHPGTRSMAARLETLVRSSNPLANPYLNDAAAEIHGRRLAALYQETGATRKISEILGLHYNHALQLLRAGQNRESIAAFDQLNRVVEGYGVRLYPDKQTTLRTMHALAYLRLGEQENCLLNHSAASCLAPIGKGGFHQLPEGSRGAIGLLMEQLKARPQDRLSAWLLNIAHMTLGEFPDGVPKPWRLPERVFASEGPFASFPEIAGGLGLDLQGLAGGCIVDDFDGDGDLDLVASSWGIRDPLRYFVHEDGRFTERTAEAGLTGLLGGLNLLQADYDNDGDLDFLVLRGAWFGREGRHPNSLVMNHGDGTFEDVTEAAGLLSFYPTQTATWFDFDLDGDLDLFVGNESTDGQPSPCELYRNRGNGRFEEIGRQVGLDHRAYVKAVAAGDFDNDGWIDLYLSCRGQPNALYRNLGPMGSGSESGSESGWRFTDVATVAGVADPLHSFPCWFFDYDNDGWEDLFVCGYQIRDVGDIAADFLGAPSQGAKGRLYRNLGDGTFEDRSQTAGVDRVFHAMGANYGDVDNDGFLDFYLGTGDPMLTTIVPNRLLKNDAGKRFLDVTAAANMGHLQKGHGIAFADWDHDGDQDVYAIMGGAYSGDGFMNALFENPGHGHGWLTLVLEGTSANRSAIGARVRVSVPQPDGTRELFRTIGSGGSFGASPLRAEIGLGDVDPEARVDVELLWPGRGADGKQVVKGLSTRRAYRLVQGSEAAEEIPWKAISFRAAEGHHH